jgi:hypothetical protein
MQTPASRPGQANEQLFRTVAAWLIVWAVLLLLLNI